MRETLQKLSQYNSWANEILLNAFSQCADQVPASSLILLSHIISTQIVWLARIKGEVSSFGAWELHDLHTCIALYERSSHTLNELLLSIDNLDEMLSYKNSEGLDFDNTIHDILLHVFNHGTYHRAQIAKDFRQHGLEPVDTDYITFVR